MCRIMLLASGGRRLNFIVSLGFCEQWPSTAATTDSECQRQRPNQDETFDKILGVIGNVEHRQSVQDDADKNRSHCRTNYVGSALIQDGKPDQRGGDTIEKQ